MALFLAHMVVLVWASYAAAHRLIRAEVERLLAAALLAWGNLVVTSLLLSGLHHLGEPAWFFRTSLALALVTWLLLRRIPTESTPADVGESRLSPLLLAAFILTLLPLAYASIRIASTYVPNNYDSLAYHLPRAMYYLGQNSLAHFDTGNPRQIYFPFNYNLLQAFGLIYGPPLQALNFFNLAAWAVGPRGLPPLPALRLLRQLRADRLLARSHLDAGLRPSHGNHERPAHRRRPTLHACFHPAVAGIPADARCSVCRTRGGTDSRRQVDRDFLHPRRRPVSAGDCLAALAAR